MLRVKSDFEERFKGYNREGTIAPFLHKGEWALHQMLEDLLERIGPAKVRLMTFNISEDSLRSFFFNHRIESLQMLLDLNIKRNKLDLLYFASEIASEIRVDAIHAKVFLVDNPTYKFGIVGSQNLNQVHRYESGFYFTGGPAFDFFSREFDDIFLSALPYDTTAVK